MLKVSDINVYYGNIHAIKDISFEVAKGEMPAGIAWTAATWTGQRSVRFS